MIGNKENQRNPGQSPGTKSSNHATKQKYPNQDTGILPKFENDDRLESILHILQYQPKDTHELLGYTLKECMRLTKSKIGFIGTLDEVKQQFLLDTWSEEVMNACKVAGEPKSFYLPNSGIWGEAIRQHKPIVVNDYSAPHPAKKGYPPGHIRIDRFVASPIFSGSMIAGVVGVGNKADPYDENDVSQLTLLMDSAWKILERQHAYQLLKEGEERFKQLTESINEAFWLKDNTTGQILYVTPKYEEIWKRTCQSFIDDPGSYLRYTHPSDIEKVIRHQEQFAHDNKPYNLEHRILLPDGSTRWVYIRTYPAKDENYRVIRTASTAEDITRRKETEIALSESQEHLDVIFATMQEGFSLHEVICDESGKPVNYRFLDVNPAFEKITGLRKEDIVGRTVLEVLPNTEPYWIELFGEVALTGIPKHFVNYSVEFDKYYEVNVYSPQIRWFAVISIDVTTQKHAEMEHMRLINELERKNAELEQFTYTVSHDLKSPLITIKGFLGLLEKDLESGSKEQASKDIQRIGNAADKMKNLLDDLLELSRIGRIANAPTEFPFQEAVTAAIELLSGRITESHVQLKIASTFPNVVGDRERIIEVIQNYLENAIKFIGNQPEPCIEIGWNTVKQEYHFYVKDNGIGINQRYHDKVFGLFEKLDSHIEGTGVGLALVKRIVEFHGGRVWMESDGLNQGSTFYFSLPNPAHKDLK